MALEADLAATLEHVQNLKGGAKTGFKNLASLDVTLNLDTANQGWWKNGEFFFYFLANDGGDPSSLVGDIQATSNIEADNDARIYEFWYQHQLSDQSRLIFGLHDYNSLYYALDSASLFTNSSFGIGPDTSQAGPSIFPETSLGLNYVHSSAHWYWQIGLYDGTPGDPNSPEGTNLKLGNKDGWFKAFELGWYSPEEEGSEDNQAKIAIGLWQQSAEAEDGQNDNFGAYLIAERALSGFDKGFVQLGSAKPNANLIHRYAGCGWVHQQKNQKAQWGLALGYAAIDEDLKQSQNLKAFEAVVEISYQYQINAHLAVQPDFQYILNPGLEFDNALVAGLRLHIN